MKTQYCLINETIKRNALSLITGINCNSRTPMVLKLREETRTDKHNHMLWPLLKDLSDQVVWYGEKLSDNEWKDMIIVLVNQSNGTQQKSAPAIDVGGRVYFGIRTSTSSRK